MSFIVSEAAISSFEEEWGLKKEQYVRVYAKYASGGADAFSIGINVGMTPIDPEVVELIGGFKFYVEKSDAWILQNKLIKIDSNEEGGVFFEYID